LTMGRGGASEHPTPRREKTTSAPAQ
jgi:hypothetical protein